MQLLRWLAMGIVLVAATLAHAAEGWSSLSSMPTPRWGLAVVASGGKIYAIGGFDGSEVKRTVEIFDPVTGLWSTGAPLTKERIWHAAAAGPNGTVYVLGGHDGTHALDSVEVYDPVSNAWSPGPTLTFARYVLAATLGPGDRIYIFGGTNGAPLRKAEVLDTTTGSWLPLPDLPSARERHVALRVPQSASAPQERIYLVGGITVGLVPIGQVDVFDVTSGTWTATVPPQPLPTPRWGLGGAAARDGRLFALGGYSGSSTPIAAEVLDTTAGTWSTLDPLPTGRFYLGAAESNDLIHAIGGRPVSPGPDPNNDNQSFPTSEAFGNAYRLPFSGPEAITLGPHCRTHHGVQAEAIDYGLTHEPVYSARAGEVAFAAFWHGSNRFGNIIQILHEGELFSFYAHLSEILVTPGQIVGRGQRIGTSGQSGDATFKPHLHFEVRSHTEPHPADPTYRFKGQGIPITDLLVTNWTNPSASCTLGTAEGPPVP